MSRPKYSTSLLCRSGTPRVQRKGALLDIFQISTLLHLAAVNCACHAWPSSLTFRGSEVGIRRGWLWVPQREVAGARPTKIYMTSIQPSAWPSDRNSGTDGMLPRPSDRPLDKTPINLATRHSNDLTSPSQRSAYRLPLDKQSIPG